MYIHTVDCVPIFKNEENKRRGFIQMFRLGRKIFRSFILISCFFRAYLYLNICIREGKKNGPLIRDRGGGGDNFRSATKIVFLEK